MLDITNLLEGHTIEEVRVAEDEELDIAPTASYGHPIVLELDSGNTVIAFQDEGLNGFGVLGVLTEEEDLYTL